MMKSLWHGSYIPREKRQKFADRWRKKLDVNMETGVAESKSPHIMDFHGAGQYIDLVAPYFCRTLSLCDRLVLILC